MKKRNGNTQLVSETPNQKNSGNKRGKTHTLSLNESELLNINHHLNRAFLDHSNEIERLSELPEDKERNQFIKQHQKCMDYSEGINSKISSLIPLSDSHLFDPELKLELLEMKHYLKHSKEWEMGEIIQNGYILDALWKGLMTMMEEFEELTGISYHNVNEDNMDIFDALSSTLLYQKIQYVDAAFHDLGKKNQALMLNNSEKEAS